MLTQIVPNILSHELTCCDFKAIDETDVVKRCAVGPNTVQATGAKDHRAIALPRFVNALNRFFYTLVARLSPSHQLFEAMKRLATWKHHLKISMQIKRVNAHPINAPAIAAQANTSRVASRPAVGDGLHVIDLRAKPAPRLAYCIY